MSVHLISGRAITVPGTAATAVAAAAAAAANHLLYPGRM